MSPMINNIEELPNLLKEIDIDIALISMICFRSFDELHDTTILTKYFMIPSDTMTAFEHIFIGNHNNSKSIGYHSEFFFPNCYGQDSLPDNDNLNKEKPYELVLPNGKNTSCFPITMNATNIITTILKAYKQAWISQPPKKLETTYWDPIIFSNELNTYLQLKTGKDQVIYNAYPLLN